jgi:hypothetical protein
LREKDMAKKQAKAARKWTTDMGEISGFGGAYEECCRKMALAGVAWLEAHPDSKLHFESFKNVYGLIMEKNKDALDLTKSMSDAATNNGKNPERGPTGAMMHACVMQALYVEKSGWKKFVAIRRKYYREDQAKLKKVDG